MFSRSGGFDSGIAPLRDVGAGSFDHAQWKALLTAQQFQRAIRRAAIADYHFVGLARLGRDRIEQRGQAARFVLDGDD